MRQNNIKQNSLFLIVIIALSGYVFFANSVFATTSITLLAPWNTDDYWIAGSNSECGGNYFGRPAGHQGIDFNGLYDVAGTKIIDDDDKEIRATHGGTVAYIGWDADGYGHYVDINHGDNILTRYAHLKFDPKLSP